MLWECYRYLGRLCKDISESETYGHVITISIFLAAVIVGVETEMDYPGSGSSVPFAIVILNQVVLGIYTLDVAIKVVAESFRPWRYLYDGWNRFDFGIVVLCYVFMLPALENGRSMIAMIRLLRLFRILKLVRSFPQLRVIVNALINSVTSIFYVSIILFVVYYIYAVIGIALFGRNDPEHFSSVQAALISMFRVATMDTWTDIM
jgi:voltage-gated sodium channel